MRLLIDGTNIRAGGGVTHLSQMLGKVSSRIGKVYLVTTIGAFDKNQNDTVENTQIHLSFFERIVYFFQPIKILAKPFKAYEIDMIFAPGGTFFSRKIKYVSMSQNMLVFEKKERNRYPFSFMWIRLNLLEFLQYRSFRNSSGIIYLSNYAKDYIEREYPILKRKKSTIIYHGISNDFRQCPKVQFSIEEYTDENPLKITYVSIIDYYKHQWVLVEAVKRLKQVDRFNIRLELVGSLYAPLSKMFHLSLKGAESYINYRGKIPYEQIADVYKLTDLFVFASTCENMPNILVEAMSAGLPILSSNHGPMPEILKDAGEYMDPTNVESVYSGLKGLILDKKRRRVIATKAYQYSKEFSWAKTSRLTFEFIKEVYYQKN